MYTPFITDSTVRSNLELKNFKHASSVQTKSSCFVSKAHPLNRSNCTSEGQINEVPLNKNDKKHN